MTETIKVYGRRFEILKNLDPNEFNYIDANLGFYKKLELIFTKQTKVGTAKLKSWSKRTDIGLVIEGKDARLCHPHGFNNDWYWGD